MLSVAEALSDGRRLLSGVSDAPEIDAEHILLHAMNKKDVSWLYAHANEAVSSANYLAYKSLSEARATGKPLAYILGSAGFFGRTYIVNEDVLIPRPETEVLVEEALKIIDNSGNISIIADIGTGSGCIAITLALARPGLKLIATDISDAALSVAKKNAELHDADDRIEFLQGDMLNPLANKDVDLIVSNPPYVPTAELTKGGNTRETRGLAFEPSIALDGGRDGGRYIDVIKNAGIPHIVETTGGNITRFTTLDLPQ